MGKIIDISGKKYGKLTCLEQMKERKKGHVVWKFKCECGNVVEARGIDVRQGKTVSCGCFQKSQSTKANKGVSPKDRKKLR